MFLFCYTGEQLTVQVYLPYYTVQVDIICSQKLYYNNDTITVQ